MAARKATKNSRKYLLIATLSVLVVIVGVVLVVLNAPKLDKATKLNINSFSECAAAGYPIQESYPERCAVPGGPTFTNDEQR